MKEHTNPATVSMLADHKQYKKDFPWHFLLDKRRYALFRAAICAVPAMAVWPMPASRRFKPAASLLGFILSWKALTKALPPKIQDCYEKYVEKAGKDYQAKWLFAPEFTQDRLSRDDTDEISETITTAYVAGIELLQLKDPATAGETLWAGGLKAYAVAKGGKQ